MADDPGGRLSDREGHPGSEVHGMKMVITFLVNAPRDKSGAVRWPSVTIIFRNPAEYAAVLAAAEREGKTPAQLLRAAFLRRRHLPMASDSLSTTGNGDLWIVTSPRRPGRGQGD